MRHWTENIGDARQELVLIGMDMDEQHLRQQLSAALVTDKEAGYGDDYWQHNDPFV